MTLESGTPRTSVRKTQLPGYNSWIADRPKQEYQVDLAFFENLKTDEDRKFKTCMFMIDPFDKYAVAVPLKSKQDADFLSGLMECFHKMGGKPESIYTDDEGSLNSKIAKQYLKDENIKHIVTLTHPHYVERLIRTIKDMLYKRLEYEREKNNNYESWWYMLPKIMLIYNNYKVHSAIKMTPKEARKPENIDKVAANLEAKRVANREYPDIEINDKVRIMIRRKL
jgi:hypothetical protein